MIQLSDPLPPGLGGLKQLDRDQISNARQRTSFFDASKHEPEEGQTDFSRSEDRTGSLGDQCLRSDAWSRGCLRTRLIVAPAVVRSPQAALVMLKALLFRVLRFRRERKMYVCTSSV